MIRQRFQYHAPETVQEATALLARVGDQAEVLGGGTWLVPEMTRGLRRPAHILDLRRASLDGVSIVDSRLVVGPRTTYAALESEPAVPRLLRTMARGITGGAQIRNQGTIGGSACYATPASDVPGILVALDASMRLSSAGGERDVPAADFFRGPFATAREPQELLSAIIVPQPDEDARYGYVKFKLVAGSWPIVTASCTTDAAGSIRSLVVGGAAATPVRVAAESVGDDLDALAELVFETVVEPWSDPLAVGKYRKVISGVIAKRAVQAARNDSERVE